MAWEPEPMFDIDSGLSAREMDVIEDRLSVIRTWIKFMGLGELEVPPPPFFLRHSFLSMPFSAVRVCIFCCCCGPWPAPSFSGGLDVGRDWLPAGCHKGLV